MLHLRLVVPAAQSGDVVEHLRGEVAVTNLVLLPGAALEPVGDVVLCDVAREGASAVLDHLRGLGIDETGSIAAEQVDLSLSEVSRRASRAAPGHGADAVVWDEVEERTSDEATLSVGFLVFLAVATMIAGVGVLLDQPILIVGAMVVGPEFGPLAGLCVALVQRSSRLAARSALALVVGFAVAMAVTVVFTWVMTAWGLVQESDLTRDRPLTDFIWQPDALSYVIGFLAGIAGMLSLTSAKSGALIGVLISVTTVPAAANAAVALAYGVGEEAWGSTVQLLVNVLSIVVAGVLTLLVQCAWWSRPAVRSPGAERSRPMSTP